MNIFSVNTNVADIEAVLSSASQVLADWESGRPHQLDLSSIADQNVSIGQQLVQLRHQSNLDGNAIIHSTRPKIGPWVIRFQQLVRRFTWWFTDPLIFQIRMFQNQAVTVITKLNQNDQQLLQNVANMTEELRDLQRRVNQLEAKLADETNRNRRKPDAAQ